MKTGKVVLVSIITTLVTVAALLAAKLFVERQKQKKNENEVIEFSGENEFEL